MNTDTGEVLRDPAEIARRLRQGEPIVEVSEDVAEMVDIGNAAVNKQSLKAASKTWNARARRRKKQRMARLTKRRGRQ